MLNRARFTALACVLLGAPCAAQLATGVNYNANTPAAPAGSRNVTWQNDGGRPTVNASAYVTYPTRQVACPAGSDLAAAVNSCLAALPSGQGGICDARACSANFTWNTATTISTANSAVLLPCGTLTATQSVTVSPGVRNTTFHGCAYQGGSAGSGTAGGTVWNYQGSGTAFIVGDPADASDTPGFQMTDMSITTPSAGASAHAMDFHRVQEIDLRRLYFIGNNSTGQSAIVLDGKGNYSGGTIESIHIASFGSALTLTGDNTGGGNASTFMRVHINCSTSAGSPISGTNGINIVYGDGNTFSGGDIEGCDTMLALGVGAKNNTFSGVRNENSNTQIAATTGSSYNLWLTGGTMFTGALKDTGSRNSFVDVFHRSWNNLNGDLWRSQADATVTNHIFTGIGLGTVRGLQDEYQTDVPSSPGSYQNVWLWGPGDGSSGIQYWVLNDLLNNVSRISVGQYTTVGGNNQTALNAAGTGGIILNGSGNSGTGGVVFGSGGASPTQVGFVDNAGNQSWNGTTEYTSGGILQWEIEGASASSFILRCPNCTVPANALIAYNNGGTEIDSQAATAVVINNHSYGGTGGFIVYEGGANSSTAALTVTGTGNTTAAGNMQAGTASGGGNLVAGNHLNQIATADFAGSCAMSGVSSCTISFQHSWSSQPACGISAGFALAGRVYYTWATNVVTIHSTSSETGTFYAICAGNPS